jgi:hypothetical protein
MQRIVLDEKDRKFVNRFRLLLVAAYLTAAVSIVLAAAFSPNSRDVTLEPRIERQASQIR